MRLLKFFVLLLIAPCLFGVFSLAQDGQPAQQGQPLVQAPAQTPQKASAITEPTAASPSAAKPVSGQDLLMKDALTVPLESLQKAVQEAHEREQFQPYRLLSGQSSSNRIDDGIYLRQTDGANVCAAIVSYNFSSGENPRLESVTTCTPANAVTSKRAKRPVKTPQGPHVVRTKYQEPDKK